MYMVYFRLIGALILTICLVGCITTTDGGRNPLSTAAGKKEAIKAYVELAMGYVRDGNTEQAKQPLIDALKLSPSDPDANAALAYLFQMESEFVEAEKYYKKALSVNSSDARILNNYAVFLFQQQRYDEARVQFLRASEDPFYSERSLVFENLGLIALQSNNSKEAEDYFQRALRLNGDRVRSIFELAKIYYIQADYVSAKRYYEGFASVVGDNQTPNSLLLGINLFNALKDQGAATKYRLMLERLYPNSAQNKQ